MTPQEKLDALGETWTLFRRYCVGKVSEVCAIGIDLYKCDPKCASGCPRLNRDTKPEREG